MFELKCLIFSRIIKCIFGSIKIFKECNVILLLVNIYLNFCKENLNY